MGYQKSDSTSKLFILFLLLSSTVGMGQQAVTTPFVPSIIGGSSAFERSLLLDWSIGAAPAIETRVLNTRFQFSMGFLQSKNEIRSLYKNQDSFNISIQIGPNPFRNSFWIRCKQEGIIITHIQLLNPLGKIIPVLMNPTSGIQFEQLVQINDAVKGVYFVFIQYLIDETLFQEKICKLLQI